MAASRISTGNPGRITVLDNQVAAKLTSTVTITGIGDVVVGLFANSVTAGATKVDITWNARSGYAAVFDNGPGVHPDDIALIGEKFATSHEDLAGSSNGYAGAFLVSLAQVTQAHIFSRHRGYIPTYATVFNFGKKISCKIEENETRRLTSMGTKVMVRNLFGDVALRARLRNDMSAAEENRLNRDVRKRLVEALLCAPEGDLRVILDDQKKRSAFVLLAADKGLARRKKILEIAGFPSVDWRPAAAEWANISVDAMIGYGPISDSHTQFIYLNSSPVARAASIYAKANAIFSASNFATANGKAGAEKHPAFVIFITAKAIPSHPYNRVDLEEPAATEVTGLVESLLEQFLREHKYSVKRRSSGPQMTGEPNPKRQRTSHEFVGVMRSRLALPPVERELFAGKMRMSEPFPLRRPPPGQMPAPERGMATIMKGRRQEQATVVQQSAVPPAPSRPLQQRPSRRSAIQGPGLAPHAYIQSPLVTPSRPNQVPKKIIPRVVPPKEVAVWGTRLTYENGSVFPLPEARIHQPYSARSYGSYSKFDEGKRVNLSKKSLETARVLPRQLEQKFILAVSEEPQALIAADQHAVDERIKLEALWKGYDNEPKPLQKPISFELSYADGEILFHHLLQVRQWGFVFDVSGAGEEATVDVRGAQELVAERCVTDPTVIIDLVIGWVGEMKSDGFKAYPAGSDWVKRQASAPRKLCDVFASRSCRSAVMFNDELTHHECITLIRELAKCTFPFICAHGRPSVVPIFDLTAGGVVEPYVD
ncbi:hypothetical protein Dda_2312 [Drechslerella dactyloides]|uniref:MutL C-terminal dimerisation domain-containing protein n=1 Tax=Drechslerella dactyloides TaxID=74499 RepID=A0AAD6J7B5_DREDA|nr:hypothetical protein Dda_2312 [Drechslerella dactyloides]